MSLQFNLTEQQKQDSDIVAIVNKQGIPDTPDIAITRDEFLTLREKGVVPNNFIGGFEVPIVVIDENIPEVLMKKEYDEEGNVVNTVVQTWREAYRVHISLDGLKAIIETGDKIDSNGNNMRNYLTCEEYIAWEYQLGIENLLTKSEAVEKIKSDEYMETVIM